MYYYRIAELTLRSEFRLHSFGEFACDPSEADVTLEATDEAPPAGKDQFSGMVAHRTVPGGWFFHAGAEDTSGLYADRDYVRLRFWNAEHELLAGVEEWFVRIALECRLIRMGYVSLHAAAVEVDRGAYAFTGPSGMGKSTRAAAWIEGLGARLVNGDRPLIHVRGKELFGVPWDGKEQCYRNVRYPLKAICEVWRCDETYVRRMTFAQKRRLLLRQCFLPMWDTDTAAVEMINISRLAAGAEIIRIFCGPEKEDARALYGALQEHHYLKEEPDMKAKSGFVLRNVVDEYILMPTGDNIGQFNGSVLLNEVSAFIWEKLQNPTSKEELLKAILDEFEVDRATASADLDALLETLRGYGVIEEN